MERRHGLFTDRWQTSLVINVLCFYTICMAKQKIWQSRFLLCCTDVPKNKQNTLKLEVKDVLLNINARRTPKGPKNTVFVPGDLDLWHLTLTFKLIRARDQTRLPCEFGANPFSGSRYISYTNKNTDWDWGRQKQNLPQFTTRGNYQLITVEEPLIHKNDQLHAIDRTKKGSLASSRLLCIGLYAPRSLISLSLRRCRVKMRVVLRGVSSES